MNLKLFLFQYVNGETRSEFFKFFKMIQFKVTQSDADKSEITL